MRAQVTPSSPAPAASPSRSPTQLRSPQTPHIKSRQHPDISGYCWNRHVALRVLSPEILCLSPCKNSSWAIRSALQNALDPGWEEEETDHFREKDGECFALQRTHHLLASQDHKEEGIARLEDRLTFLLPPASLFQPIHPSHAG